MFGRGVRNGLRSRLGLGGDTHEKGDRTYGDD